VQSIGKLVGYASGILTLALTARLLTFLTDDQATLGVHDVMATA